MAGHAAAAAAEPVPGWLLKVDGASGRLLGWAPSAGNHGMDVMGDGTLLLGPGPGLVAQRYRKGA